MIHRQQKVNWDTRCGLCIYKTTQWHTSSNKTTPTPVKPHLLIVPLPMSLCGPITFKRPRYQLNFILWYLGRFWEIKNYRDTSMLSEHWRRNRRRATHLVALFSKLDIIVHRHSYRSKLGGPFSAGSWSFRWIWNCIFFFINKLKKNWGDDLICKVLALPTGAPEFGSQHLCESKKQNRSSRSWSGYNHRAGNAETRRTVAVSLAKR